MSEFLETPSGHSRNSIFVMNRKKQDEQMVVGQNKIYNSVISIKEIFESFNNGQFVSLTFPSIFVSLSFLFFICVIIPFALSTL